MITIPQVLVFFLIFARVIGVTMTSPFFSDKQLLMTSKVSLSIFLSGLLIFVVKLPLELPSGMFTVVLALLMEFMVGVMLGFVAQLMVTGVEFAGSLMDTQAGVSAASLLDPSSGRNAAVFERFLKAVAVLLFILVDGHHMVLSALNQSFYILPIGAPVNIQQGTHYIFSLGGMIYKSAVMIAAPIILVVFIVDFAFGILNRVAEQVNVFQLGFQIKPTVSVIIFMAIVPGMVQTITTLMKEVLDHLVSFMSVMQVSL